MKLLLSSDALPDATAEGLRVAGRRRSLAGLELRLGAGHHHGADASPCAIRHEAGVDCFPATPTDLPIAWLLLPDEADLAMRSIWSSAAYGLGAGVLLRRATVECPALSHTALLHDTDLDAARRAVAWAEDHGAQTGWEVRPAAFDPDRWTAVLDATGPHLAHVRLLGAGPEAEAEGGASDGTGWLLSRLALRGYGGTVALAPSSPEHLAAWERWLRRGRGWGWGSAAEKKAAAERKVAAGSTR
ncbi:MAG: hypothetical protein ABJF88_08375 [Rhodothermales bacterium]